MKALQAGDLGADTFKSLIDNHLDVHEALDVQVSSHKSSNGNTVLHVNVNGICLLRLSDIRRLHVSLCHDPKA